MSGPIALNFPAEHSWPIAIRAGSVVLRPLGRWEKPAWDALREANYGWTSEWDATTPPDGEYCSLPYRRCLRMMNKRGKQGTCLPWALAIDHGWPSDPVGAEQARLIGQVSVSDILAGSARSAVIGYWIDQTYAGHGIMPVAVALACDYCWQVMRMHRIEICVRPENAASLRVVEKLGFRQEGIRPRYLHINGDWRDHRVFALNREEVPGGLINRLLAAAESPGDSAGSRF